MYIHPLKNLTLSEWHELLGLEYILTWNYTDDSDRDEKRHKELSDKRWEVNNG